MEKKTVWKKTGNTWFGNPSVKTDYRNVCFLANQELHDRFLQLSAECGLIIGQVMTDDAEKIAFCEKLGFDYIPVYSIITHK